jgi:hypothetical protein
MRRTGMKRTDMAHHRRTRAQRMYRRIIRLYPGNHRRTFGEQMVQTFGDHYRDVVEARHGSRVRFWLAVLADTGTSLLTEHKDEHRTRRRQTAELRARRRHAAKLRARRQCNTAKRRRSRVKRVRFKRPPVRRLVLAVLVWLGFRRPRVPAGPHRDGPAPPGGAGVREPRRPRPVSPAGAAARPHPDQDPVALISRKGGMPASTSW